MLLNAYTCTSILLLLNRHSIKPYYKMISMLCSIMVTLGICFSIILSVHTCIFISIQVQILLLTTSIIWKYPKKTETKDLGITFNTYLHWDQHCKNITSRVYKCLYLLKPTINTHATASKKLLYISLVRSQLIYCSQLWRPYLLKDIIILERIQRRATKFILNDYQSSYRFRLVKLYLLSLMYLFELYDIIFVIKSLKNPTIPFNIYNYIQFHSSSSRLSHANKLQGSRKMYFVGGYNLTFLIHDSLTHDQQF